ncbi:helix-turn-helix domain-containing protein [Streptomyces fagopyri]|uniref:helix-turn-helix domain-containing protein n=1 Tax=Streptomyces fagopyri TaxID=2662397 RepID=UPI00340F057A
MPRWKALPDELDPQVKEFAVQLRRLVDRSGLGIAALADRTGYSRTSWERYLNGRLLAPKGAVVALAEVTGTSPVHLTTMWELAERAWSRSEMRHDMTMEAIRISQARAALGEFGAPPANGSDGRRTRNGRGATVMPGIAGPAGVVPSVPPQPAAGDVEDSVSGTSSPPAGGARGGSSSGGASRGGGGWGAVATPPSGGAGRFGPPVAAGPARPAASSGGASAGGRPSAGASSEGVSADGALADKARRRRRLTMFLAGVVGALVVIGVAVLLTGGGGDKKNQGTPKAATTSAAVRPDLPAGVKCGGGDCTGKDPENMGCGGRLATTSTSVTVGTTLVEVRYSKTCAAAWARITQAVVGDSVVVSAGGAPGQSGSVDADADTDAYTPMIAVEGAGEAKACVTLKSGLRGCTR